MALVNRGVGEGVARPRTSIEDRSPRQRVSRLGGTWGRHESARKRQGKRGRNT